MTLREHVRHIRRAFPSRLLHHYACLKRNIFRNSNSNKLATLTLKLQPHAMRNILDALSPNSLVQFGVQSDIFHTHGLLSKVDYGLDSPGCPLLE